MKIPRFWSNADPTGPSEARRLTGSPQGGPLAGPLASPQPGPQVRVDPAFDDPAAAAGAPPEPAAPNGSTPVANRLQRLAKVVDGARHRRTDRDVRKLMQWLGGLATGLGFAAIFFGWYGVAHSPYLYEEIAYLASGGLLGVALVILGAVLMRGAWSMRQVEEARRNAVAIVRSVDRLERVLRSFEASRTDDQRAEELTPWN